MLRRDFNSGVFLWILRNFQENLFWRASANGCVRTVVVINWKTSLMFIHRIEYMLSFKDLSYKIMCADIIKLWWRKYVLYEASFLSSHILDGFGQSLGLELAFFELLHKNFTYSLVNVKKSIFFELALMATTVKSLFTHNAKKLLKLK